VFGDISPTLDRLHRAVDKPEAAVKDFKWGRLAQVNTEHSMSMTDLVRATRDCPAAAGLTLKRQAVVQSSLKVSYRTLRSAMRADLDVIVIGVITLLYIGSSAAILKLSKLGSTSAFRGCEERTEVWGR
jgi:hypothetical protein